MGCACNSDPGTNRHEALCVLSVLQGHQCKEGGRLCDPNLNCSPVGLQKIDTGVIQFYVNWENIAL